MLHTGHDVLMTIREYVVMYNWIQTFLEKNDVAFGPNIVVHVPYVH